MQKDKILGASACSLLKTFWIFLHANVYVCLFPFLYTKIMSLKNGNLAIVAKFLKWSKKFIGQEIHF